MPERFFDIDPIGLWFKNFPKRLDQRAITTDMLKLMLAFTTENFVREGYYGTKWAALAPSTVEERTRKGYMPINILRRAAGAAGLFGSIFTQLTANNQGFIGVGANIFYAGYLQFGTKKMPARPFLPKALEPELMTAITDLFVGNEVLKYIKLI